jgi:hypothetical protein
MQSKSYMRFSILVSILLLISVISCTQSDMKCFEELLPKTVGHGKGATVLTAFAMHEDLTKS